MSRFVQDALDVISTLPIPAEYGQPSFKLDAGESAFLERQLESVESKLYEHKRRELKYRILVPVSNEDDPGAETISYDMFTLIGMAKIIANPADDLPRADVYVERKTASVRTIGTSFSYSTQDIRRAQFSGVPLDTFKVSAARRSVREKENSITWFGDSQYNLVGLLNNPNIPVTQVVQASGGGLSRVWGVDKTPAEVAEDIASLQTGIKTTTKEIHVGNTLLLPIDKLQYLATTPMSPTIPTMTILKWIKDPENGFDIQDVVGVPELTGSGPGGTDQMFLYERDDEVLQHRIPMEMMTYPPQQVNLQFKVPVESRTAGVIVRYPLACSFGYGI